MLLRWTNPAYWSVQGPVWAQAAADKHADVGKWFSWGNWTPSETFAPRVGKKTDCVADDGYRRPANATTLQGAFLECLKDRKCDNVYIEYAKIGWMAAVQPLKMTLLGKVDDPSVACKPGTGLSLIHI